MPEKISFVDCYNNLLISATGPISPTGVLASIYVGT